MHASLPYPPLLRTIHPRTTPAADRRAEARAETLWQLLRVSQGVFPARRRNGESRGVVHGWGFGALKLALVGYAGDAQHEVYKVTAAHL